MGLSDMMMKGINAVAGAIGTDVSRTLELDNVRDWDYGELDSVLGVASDEGFRDITTIIFGDTTDEPLRITIGSDGVTKVEGEGANGETVTIEIDRETGDVRSAVTTNDRGEVYTFDVRETLESRSPVGEMIDSDGRTIRKDVEYTGRDGTRVMRSETITYSSDMPDRVAERHIETYNLDTYKVEETQIRYDNRADGGYWHVRIDKVDYSSGDKFRSDIDYGRDGRVAERREFYSSDNNARTVDVVYQDGGRVVVDTEYTHDNHGVLLSRVEDRQVISADGKVVEHDVIESRKHDREVTEIKYIGDNGAYVEKHSVDGKDVYIKECDGAMVTKSEMDGDGRIVSREVTTVDGELVSHSEFVYEGDGVIETVYDSDGNVEREVESVWISGVVGDDEASGMARLVIETDAEGNETVSMQVDNREFVGSAVETNSDDKRFELRPSDTEATSGRGIDTIVISRDSEGKITSIEKEVNYTNETGERTLKTIDIKEIGADGRLESRAIFVGDGKEDGRGTVCTIEYTKDGEVITTTVRDVSETEFSNVVENPQDYDREVEYRNDGAGVNITVYADAGDDVDRAGLRVEAVDGITAEDKQDDPEVCADGENGDPDAEGRIDVCNGLGDTDTPAETGEPGETGEPEEGDNDEWQSDDTDGGIE